MWGSDTMRRSYNRRTVLGVAGVAFTSSLAGCSSADGPGERNSEGVDRVGNARQAGYHLLQWEAELEEGEWDASEEIDVDGPRDIAFAVRALSGTITIHLMPESEFQDNFLEEDTYEGVTVTDSVETYVTVERFSSSGISNMRVVADNTGTYESALAPEGSCEVRIQMEIETF